MKESYFQAKVRDNLQQPPHSMCHKISDMFVAGMPDCFVARWGTTTFLELKADEWPKRPDTPVGCNVSVPQYRFLTRLRQAGVPAWVLLGVGQHDWFLLNHFYMPAPKEKERLVLPQDTLRAHVVEGSPIFWDRRDMWEKLVVWSGDRLTQLSVALDLCAERVARKLPGTTEPYRSK